MRQLSITIDSGVGDERTADLTREIADDIYRSGDFDVEIPVRLPAPGERAAGIELLGHVAVTVLSAGAIKPLVECLVAYLKREKTLDFQISSGGATVRLAASNLSQRDLKEAVQLVTQELEALQRPAEQ